VGKGSLAHREGAPGRRDDPACKQDPDEEPDPVRHRHLDDTTARAGSRRYRGSKQLRSGDATPELWWNRRGDPIQGGSMAEARMEERRQLEDITRRLRRDIITSTTKAGSGHPSTSLSMVEVLTVLYFGGVLRYDPQDPLDPGRDRFILSKGHGAPGLYAVLAEAGYFSTEELGTLRQLGSRLEGHPNMNRLPGVEASTGSLGQGLSIGIGHALAGKLDASDYRVYVMVGDGESEEGQVWEALMYAGNHEVDNLTLVVDRNAYQQTAAVDEIQPLDPLDVKLSAFGWEVRSIDGHSLDAVSDAFDWARRVSGSPQAIIANTIKGKGVSLLEKSPGSWHGKAVPPEEEAKALEEIGAAR
jgi:transketolase